MRQLLPVFAIVLFSVSLHSCLPSNRLYLFNDKLPGRDTLNTAVQVPIQKIQRNDRLMVTVSSTDPALTAYLNPFNIQNSANTTSQQANTGYLVSPAGAIDFPLLGEVKVAGLTTVQAAKLIKDSLSVLYKNLFVNVNMRGQVYFMNGRSGTTIPMINERLTILEAMTQSGVQDPYDKKNEVMLIRDSSGIRTYTKLDLNSKDIFQSPYFYLQNNDFIYLKPGKLSSFLSPTSPGRVLISIGAALLTLLLALRNL